VTKVNVADAKARLSHLIDRALAGEDVVIARRNRPLVRLTVVREAKPKRTVGWARGRITTAPDFDAAPSDFDEYTRP